MTILGLKNFTLNTLILIYWQVINNTKVKINKSDSYYRT